jgi:hypothetical protein
MNIEIICIESSSDFFTVSEKYKVMGNKLISNYLPLFFDYSYK